MLSKDAMCLRDEIDRLAPFCYLISASLIGLACILSTYEFNQKTLTEAKAIGKGHRKADPHLAQHAAKLQGVEE
jgi:hypothetical protein